MEKSQPDFKMTVSKSSNEYVPSLKYDLLTSLYDSVQKWTFPELSSQSKLINQSTIKRGSHVLDIGCGSATLTSLIKKNHPDAIVVGLDADPKVLEIAKKKAAKDNLDIRFDLGFSNQLPYDNESFDVVFSSLLFHHLTKEKKIQTLKEVFRVLRSGGEFHVADWGKPQNVFMRIAFLPVQLLDGFETTSDNVKGLLPELFLNAGFNEIQQTAKYTALFGTFLLHKLIKI